MDLIDGNPETSAVTYFAKNGIQPWFAIDFGEFSTSCQIFKIRIRGLIPYKTGNINVTRLIFLLINISYFHECRSTERIHSMLKTRSILKPFIPKFW